MTDTSAAPPAADFDVLGIGNALVDVLSREDDAFIDRLTLVKGAMTLIDAERAEELYDAMGTEDRDVRRVGGQHAGRRRLVRRPRPRTSAGCVTTCSARCSPTISKQLGVHFTSPRPTDGDPHRAAA